MAENIDLARAAIIEAIETLVAEGNRPYSLNVPTNAENILVRNGRGRLTRAQAYEDIRAALSAMISAGEIEIFTEPNRDWRLIDSAPPNLITGQQADRTYNFLRIPWAGKPSESHICLSALGVGGGLIGVHAAYVPYLGNFGRTVEELQNLLGWPEAIPIGSGKEALAKVINQTSSQLAEFGVPKEGLDNFLSQLTNEAWITTSSSPIGKTPLPDDATAVVEHGKIKGLFAFIRSKSIIIFFAGTLFGAVAGDFGKGALAEIIGIESFDKAGRQVVISTQEKWNETWKALDRISAHKNNEERPSEPRLATRPED